MHIMNKCLDLLYSAKEKQHECIESNKKKINKCYLSKVSALGPQLIDLGLSDVSSLLGFLQLMLRLPQFSQMSTGLLLLG